MPCWIKRSAYFPPQRHLLVGVFTRFTIGANSLLMRPFSGKPIPIYVGKAVPAGGRKGGDSLSGEDLEAVMLTEPNPGHVLYKRLGEHADSIAAATNLKSEDFRCHYLAVTPIWITFSEGILIRKFRPVWNVLVNGFGNHDVGKGRHKQRRSEWDEIHPGREWATRCQPAALPAAGIIAKIRAAAR